MALDVNVVQLNVLFKALIPKIKEKHILLEIDYLLEACQEVAASKVGILSFRILFVLSPRLIHYDKR